METMLRESPIIPCQEGFQVKNTTGVDTNEVYR